MKVFVVNSDSGLEKVEDAKTADISHCHQIGNISVASKTTWSNLDDLLQDKIQVRNLLFMIRFFECHQLLITLINSCFIYNNLLIMRTAIK